ncbi:protein FAM171B-like [Thalassophryne amazonica]|uniref:protein FAM171B-like n=1 Tax=Thalassophryne amazonica TaxID=390379 RepID=UPI0014708FD2|nr:protein FAM171B-like [Thalassophryne amazonica]
MLLLTCLFFALVLFSRTVCRLSEHVNDGNFSKHQDQIQQPPVSNSSPGSAFTLKVQVNDMWNRDYLSQALVEVYVNYTWTSEALTGEDGTATVAVPYQTGLPITVVASKEGYIWMPLPYKTSRMPSKMIYLSTIVNQQALSN